MEGLMGKCRFCGNEFGVLAEDQRAADEAASKAAAAAAGKKKWKPGGKNSNSVKNL